MSEEAAARKDDEGVCAAPRLEARGLCRSFRMDGGEIAILKDLDFAVGPGDSVAVTGASGIGKSTLLHILGTLDRPDSGTLLVDGLDVFSRSARELARFRNETVGFVFQFHHLLPEFSALENAAIPRMIAGQKKRPAQEKARAMLERVNSL